MTKTRSILLNSILVVVPLLLLEIVIRVGAYAYYGFNAYYLTYGFKSPETRLTTDAVVHDGYFKFKENSVVMQGALTELRIQSRINNIGLRGSRNVSLSKPEKVVRVIALGESSTFGYHADDTHTYPALLEQKLQLKLGDRPVEVINAGIPNFDSNNLVAILEKELLAYKPDVITVYAAYNDAVGILDHEWWQKLSRWLHDHLGTYVALGRLMASIADAAPHTKWTGYVASPSSEYVAKQIALHVEKYERNIGRIIEVGTASGATVVLIRQPMATSYLAAKDRPDYDELVATQRGLLATGGAIDGKAVTLLVHASLLEVLDKLAGKHSVPVVDNVRIVDEKKDRLQTYVHLSEEGNAALASAIAETLEPILR
jgi:lysophospholipase L1-like esterase